MISIPSEILSLLGKIPWKVWPLVAVVIELGLWRRYRRLANEATRRPVIAPIHFSGAIEEGFRTGSEEVLRDELSRISGIYREIQEKQGFTKSPVGIGTEFSRMMTMASASLNLDPLALPTDYSLESATKEIRIQTKFFKAPLSAVVKVLSWLIDALPAPDRARYLASRFHISVGCTGTAPRVRVFRDPRHKASQGGEAAEARMPTVYERGKDDPNEPNDALLQDAAFMVLQLEGRAFPELNWRGMKYFTNALDYLLKYRGSGKPDDLKNAKENLELAVSRDAKHYEARCFLGFLLVAERKPQSIRKALRVFREAERAKKANFRAFVLTGQAQCYLQLYHRVGEQTQENLKRARRCAAQSKEQWEGPELDPWILYTGAVVRVVDEGRGRTDDEMKGEFVAAAELVLKAIEADDDNPLFYNLLGWILLKLAERGIGELTASDGASEPLVGNSAEKSEYYLKESITFNELNKLSHANLCLLYATPHFAKGEKSHLNHCRTAGRKAVEIDPEYTNGYRDLAVSLIRYRSFDEAYDYYKHALFWAKESQKDDEIMRDVIKVIRDTNAKRDERQQEENLHRWENPPTELLT